MNSSSLSIEQVSIDRVFLSPSNPRHNDEAVPHVAASLRRFGFQQPIVAKRSGEVIAGNTRLKAAKSLGLTQVPVVWFDGTDLDATAFGIADNKTHEFSSWDDGPLAQLLEQLRTEDSLDGVGFSTSDIDALIAEIEAKDAANRELDDPGAIEPPDKATTRTGDLWVLGKHRLLCGDSSLPADLDRLLGGARIHLVNTDPPYNVKVEPRSNNAIAAGLSSFSQTHHQKLDVERHPEKSKPTTRKMRAKDRPLMNDFVSVEEFDRLLLAWFGNIARVLEPGGGFYIWGGYANCANYPPALKACELYFSQSIIWDKQHPVLTRKDFMGAHEWCFYGWREGAAHHYYGPNNATDLWAIKKVNPQSMVHLCLHPDAAVLTVAGYRPIRALQPGDRVLAGDGKFHRVEHVSSHRYQSDCLYRITAKGGNATTDASDNHPFLIWRPKRRGAAIEGGEVLWLRADQLEVGDYTMTPALCVVESDPFPELSEEDWFLFGLYLAQGHLQRAGHGDRRYPVFSIHKKRQDLAHRIWNRWPRTSEYDPNDYNETASSGLTVMAFDGDAGERFEALGGRLAHDKRLAPEIFTLPRAKRLAVLQGWLNGDGCMVHDRSYWQGNTVSADLAAQLCLLAESVGYRANEYAYDPPEELGSIGGRKFKSQRRVHHLYFYERNARAQRGSPTRVEHEGREYALRYVKKIERVRYEGDVWNLSVEGHPSFQTAVGLSHNTEKPVELAQRAIEYSSKPGENILDLFGGSGSTLIAAEKTARRAYLMEMDEPYCDVIVMRWQQATGGKALLEGTKQNFDELRAEREVAS